MTEKIPDISVLMPAYNAASYITLAIDSILAQSYPNFELIIVDDGSVDDTATIIASYLDPRIRLIRQANGGVSAALNAGLAAAKGHYIARADADDICFPDRFLLQKTFLDEHPDYVIVGSDVDYMDEKGNFLFHFQNNRTGYTDEEIKARFYNYCPFIHSSVMYRTSVVKNLGGYDPRAVAFEDYFLWSRLLEAGKFHNLKAVLMKIRLNISSVTVDDRDYPESFRRLKQQAMSQGALSDADWVLLRESYRSISRSDKARSYYLLLGKKYLWDNYQPELSRRNIRQAIRLKPLTPAPYLLYLLTFAGRKTIERIYHSIKRGS